MIITVDRWSRWRYSIYHVAIGYFRCGSGAYKWSEWFQHCFNRNRWRRWRWCGQVIILNALGNIFGISANANGGNGVRVLECFTIEAEGPGGGGGGGYIAISGGAITRTANGGTNGNNKFPQDDWVPQWHHKGRAEFQMLHWTFKILPASVMILRWWSNNNHSQSGRAPIPPGICFLLSGTICCWWNIVNHRNNAYTTPLSSNTTY